MTRKLVIGRRSDPYMIHTWIPNVAWHYSHYGIEENEIKEMLLSLFTIERGRIIAKETGVKSYRYLNQRTWKQYLVQELILFLKEKTNRTFISIFQLTPLIKRDDIGDLKELRISIDSIGIDNDLLVKPIEGSLRYHIVNGYRRYRACKLGGRDLRPIPVLPCRIELMDDNHAHLKYVASNHHQKSLNPIEEAKEFKVMYEEMMIPEHEIANAIGRDYTYVSNAIRLLNLPEDVQKLIAEGEMHKTHGLKLLITYEDSDVTLLKPEEMSEFARHAIREHLSTGALEEVVKKSREIDLGLTEEDLRTPLQKAMLLNPCKYMIHAVEVCYKENGWPCVVCRKSSTCKSFISL